MVSARTAARVAAFAEMLIELRGKHLDAWMDRVEADDLPQPISSSECRAARNACSRDRSPPGNKFRDGFNTVVTQRLFHEKRISFVKGYLVLPKDVGTAP